MATLLTSPAFYRIPEEVLTLIIHHAPQSKDFLSRLRLVHARFAYLKRLQQVLFFCRCLTVESSTPGVRPPKSIVPFVRCVAFRTFSIRKFQDIAHRVDEWRSVAKKVLSYLKSEEAKRDVIGILSTLPNATKFIIYCPLSNPKEQSTLLAVPLGDALLKLAVACLVDGNIVPTALAIHREGYEQQPARWADLPQESSLDLSQLEELKYQFVYGLSSGLCKRAYVDTVTDIIAKGANALKRLHLESNSLVLWPSHPTNHVPLLQLKELTLSSCRLVAEPLSHWLSDCVLLQILNISNSRIGTAVYRHRLIVWSEDSRTFLDPWHEVFRAIRDHRQRIRVTLHGIVVHIPDATGSVEPYILSLSHNTDEQILPEDDLGSHMRQTLKDFIDGREEWGDIATMRNI